MWAKEWRQCQPLNFFCWKADLATSVRFLYWPIHILTESRPHTLGLCWLLLLPWHQSAMDCWLSSSCEVQRYMHVSLGLCHHSDGFSLVFWSWLLCNATLRREWPHFLGLVLHLLFQLSNADDTLEFSMIFLLLLTVYYIRLSLKAIFLPFIVYRKTDDLDILSMLNSNTYTQYT